jgi:hypothetical protein
MGGSVYQWTVNKACSLQCVSHDHNSADIDRSGFNIVHGSMCYDPGGCILGTCELREGYCVTLFAWNEFEYGTFWLVGPITLEAEREMVALFLGGDEVGACLIARADIQAFRSCNDPGDEHFRLLYVPDQLK